MVHDEKLYDLYRSPDILKILKSKRMHWVELIEWGTNILVKKRLSKRHLEETLKRIKMR
jgi:hypothetical protein